MSAAGVDAFIRQLMCVDRDVDDAARVDVLRSLEELKSACAAAQAKVTADLDASRRAERVGLPRGQRDRGVGSEVALARRESPHRGGRYVGFASAVVHEMPNTLALLESGVLNEWRATILVQETACLTREDRSAIDTELCTDPTVVEGLGDLKLRAAVKNLAARFDVDAVVKRAQKAEAERRVSIRPAQDTMAYVTALLPVRQAVWVQATLGRDADSIVAVGDDRTRSQIMADLLVERVTGVREAMGPPVVVNLVLSDEILFGDGTDNAHVDGYGPIPAGLARKWTNAGTDLQLRKLYATPKTGALTAMESQSRCYPAGLSRFIDVRDRSCRTPWCDAPIRHHDHIVDHVNGGETTANNAAGLCEACNHAKQGAGWHAQPDPPGQGELHSFRITTPNGHTYRSTAPPLSTPLEIEGAA